MVYRGHNLFNVHAAEAVLCTIFHAGGVVAGSPRRPYAGLIMFEGFGVPQIFFNLLDKRAV
ncbi:hypothetical protein M529_14485 [Sphingobium ummariense RL-3]|uniref:Uncharacterized protein n=1 Tax=Sphingobium ummariense RL-3 TaxID=1346791 RepID=T0J3T4_9SPHN|nr:hypothetical protein M529_14485 [Sphingobium ummariense RL-3]